MSSSKSFKMVRDIVRYKQSCTKTMPSFVGGTLGGTLGRASDDEHSESFKMVRDIVLGAS